MADMEPFTLVEESQNAKPHHLFDDMAYLTSAKSADHDIQYIKALRDANPGMIVTAVPTSNVSLRAFAAAGYATCELDTKTDSFASWRGYVPPAKRSQTGQLGEAIFFAKWHYKWKNEDFILFTTGIVQYILKERRGSEHVLGPSNITDELIKTIGDWVISLGNVIWVYDNYWMQSTELYEEVQKASWDKVILDESMKKDLTTVANKFFSSKKVYEDLGVPWKRGLMFYGPPGNGKTISIKALMHELYQRDDPIPSLYVKSAPYTYNISAVFRQARALAPCMLILEDIETIVKPDTRSYFFNEMDGLENNDGLFVVASTNFLERLDPGLTKRPSRFDRKYEFALPTEHERTLYCEFWREKLKPNKDIEFPKKLCAAMAHITPEFSFAFLQECFVATLLILAREEEDDESTTDEKDDDLNEYKLWVAFKKEADILRKEIDSQRGKPSQLMEWYRRNGESSGSTYTTGPPSTQSTVNQHQSQNQAICCHDKHGHHHHHHHDDQTASRAMSRLNIQRKALLPELPWEDLKFEVVNPAAMQLV